MKYCLILFCFWIYSAGAQKAVSAVAPLYFSVAYYHNGFSNPGLQGEIEWILKDINKTKEKESRRVGTYTVTRRRQLALEGRLGFFWDPLTHVGVFNQYLFSTRLVHQGPKQDHPQWLIALGLGPGYFRSFLSETYEVDANNNITKIQLPGRGYFAPVLAFKFIRERPHKKLKSWFLEFNTQWLFHYNSGVVPLNSLVFGFRFPLKKTSS